MLGQAPDPRGCENVLCLLGDGVGRNQIARNLGVTTRAVSKVVRDAGLTFDRAEKTRAATEIRKVDMAARRTALAEKLYDLADEWAEQTRRP